MMDNNLLATPLEQKIKLGTHQNFEKINTTVYDSILGKFCYLTHSKPDLMFSVGLLSRFMENPFAEHP